MTNRDKLKLALSREIAMRNIRLEITLISNVPSSMKLYIGNALIADWASTGQHGRDRATAMAFCEKLKRKVPLLDAFNSIKLEEFWHMTLRVGEPV